jgi:hypothetical protein
MGNDEQYPLDFDNDEIVEAIRGDLAFLDKVTSTRAQIQKSAKIQIGLSELQKRQSDKSYETAVMSARSAIKWAKVAIFIAAVSMLLGALDYFGDKVWRGEQLREIREIKAIVSEMVKR